MTPGCMQACLWKFGASGQRMNFDPGSDLDVTLLHCPCISAWIQEIQKLNAHRSSSPNLFVDLISCQKSIQPHARSTILESGYIVKFWSDTKIFGSRLCQWIQSKPFGQLWVLFRLCLFLDVNASIFSS
ncbi:unnamed protein product [Cuscuta epithymum]|uniref:Polymerase nucleotidyl transferase domain-containing protein n=1 Tax=Cuscuta epithymum TaxID=186058 RepID=A0AAV0EYA4_9ASTE|nr:unnamed protein product [Cuscuta epithymum]